MTKTQGPDGAGLGFQEKAVLSEAREALQEDNLELFHKIAYANPDLAQQLQECEAEYFSRPSRQ